jgi:type II secretory pathway predicted ATPase ExeA
MFENQLGLRENPFVSGHQAKYVYPSREHQEALAHLRYGIENREPFVLITGEVGTGKTTAIYDALTEWGAMAVVALITNSALDRSELVEEICLRFGVPLMGAVTKPQAMVQLERHLGAIRARGELAILLIDEAQNLDDSLLEEIRLLSNVEIAGEKLLQIFLVGQPELEDKLARPELRQLKQRIAIHYRLAPLTDVETKRYIHHRVSVAGGNAYDLFPLETCQTIFGLTKGIPREINTVAGQSLLNAFVADSKQVLPEHVTAVAEESEFRSVLEEARSAGREAPAGAPPGSPATPHEAVHAPPAPPRSAEAASPPGSGNSQVFPPNAEELDSYTPGPAVRPTQAPRSNSQAGNPMSTEPIGPDGYALPTWLEDLAAGQKPPASPAPTGAEPPIAPLSAVPIASANAPAYPPAAPVLPTEPEGVLDEPLPARPGPVLHRPAESAPRIERDSLEWRESVPTTSRDSDFTAVGEMYGGGNRPAEPAEADPAMMGGPAAMSASAAPVRPAPERIAPHPSDPGVAEATGPVLVDSGLSPRLRAKLSDSSPRSGQRGPLNPWAMAGGVVGLLGLIAFFLVRFGPGTEVPSDPTAVSSPAPAPAAPVEEPPAVVQVSPPPAQRPAPPPSSSASSRPATAAALPTTTPPATATASAAPTRPAPTAASKPAAPKSTYSIVVATYINEERANAERDKLAASTGLPTRIATAQEDGASVYRVVVGSFPDRRRAEQSASDLVGKGLINEARITSSGR